MHPVDANTGLQSGSEVHSDPELILKGYLVTHENGFEVRLNTDRGHAELYAVRNRATMEPLYVLRKTKTT